MMALGGTAEAVTATVQQMGRESVAPLSIGRRGAAGERNRADHRSLYTGIAGKSGDVGKVPVRFGADYLATYTGDVAREMKGILYHEMTHIYQHDDKPEGMVPRLVRAG